MQTQSTLCTFLSGHKVSGISLINEVMSYSPERLLFVLEQHVQSLSKEFIIFQLKTLEKIFEIKVECINLNCIKSLEFSLFEIIGRLNMSLLYNTENKQNYTKIEQSRNFTMFCIEALEFYINSYNLIINKLKDLKTLTDLDPTKFIKITDEFNYIFDSIIEIKYLTGLLFRKDILCYCTKPESLFDDKIFTQTTKTHLAEIIKESLIFFRYNSNNFILNDYNTAKKLAEVIKSICEIKGEKFKKNLEVSFLSLVNLCEDCIKYSDNFDATHNINTKNIDISNFQLKFDQSLRKVLILGSIYRFSLIFGKFFDDKNFLLNYFLSNFLKEENYTNSFVFILNCLHKKNSTVYSNQFLINLIKILMRFFDFNITANKYYSKLIKENNYAYGIVKNIHVMHSFYCIERKKEFFNACITSNSLNSNLKDEKYKNPLYLNLNIKDLSFNINNLNISEIIIFKNYFNSQTLKDYVLQKLVENFYNQNNFNAKLTEIVSPEFMHCFDFLKNFIENIYSQLFNKNCFFFFNKTSEYKSETLNLTHIKNRDNIKNLINNSMNLQKKKQPAEMEIYVMQSIIVYKFKNCIIKSTLKQYLHFEDFIESTKPSNYTISSTNIKPEHEIFIRTMFDRRDNNYTLKEEVDGRNKKLSIDFNDLHKNSIKVDLTNLCNNKLIKPSNSSSDTQKEPFNLNFLAKKLKKEKIIPMDDLDNKYKIFISQLQEKKICEQKDGKLFYIP